MEPLDFNGIGYSGDLPKNAACLIDVIPGPVSVFAETGPTGVDHPARAYAACPAGRVGSF